MPACVPIKDLKDTAAFSRKVETARGPITVTRNGYDAFVVMKSDDYEAMQEELTKARLLARITQAESEYANGKHSDGDNFTQSIKRKYDL